MHFDWSQIIDRVYQPSTLQELSKLEDLIGFPLPDDYKHFLQTVNGGSVNFDNSIAFIGAGFEVSLVYLLPTNLPKPGLDLFDQRRHQVRCRWGARQSIIIGDDMGTGRFLLMLDGAKRGSVFFGFHDELDNRSSEWNTNRILVTDPMHFITDSFDSLGELILQNPAS